MITADPFLNPISYQGLYTEEDTYFTDLDVDYDPFLGKWKKKRQAKRSQKPRVIARRAKREERKSSDTRRVFKRPIRQIVFPKRAAKRAEKREAKKAPVRTPKKTAPRIPESSPKRLPVTISSVLPKSTRTAPVRQRVTSSRATPKKTVSPLPRTIANTTAVSPLPSSVTSTGLVRPLLENPTVTENKESQTPQSATHFGLSKKALVIIGIGVATIVVIGIIKR